MGFILIEARMPDGPKFAGIPSTAGWLWVAAMAYSAAALTDGFVPASKVYKLTNDPPKVVDEAVRWLMTVQPQCENPLWHAVEGGWQIHDYDDPEYKNPTRASTEGARQAKSEAGRKGGQASVEARRRRYGSAQPNSDAEASPEAHPEAGASRCFEAGASNGAEAAPKQGLEALPKPQPNPTRSTYETEPPLPPHGNEVLAGPWDPTATWTPPDSGLERGVQARVQLLQEVCRDVLKRDVLGDEWPMVRRWVEAKREAKPIPLEELEAAARYYLSQPTRTGRMPFGLGFIDKQMLALAREPFRVPDPAPPVAPSVRPHRGGPRPVVQMRPDTPDEDRAGMRAAMNRGPVA